MTGCLGNMMYLGIQSYGQRMIGVSNHLLSIVFWFHYHSQNVIESLGIHTWNSKQPVLYGGFEWMVQNNYMRNGCLTKHPLKTGCSEFQVFLPLYSLEV